MCTGRVPVRVRRRGAAHRSTAGRRDRGARAASRIPARAGDPLPRRPRRLPRRLRPRRHGRAQGRSSWPASPREPTSPSRFSCGAPLSGIRRRRRGSFKHAGDTVSLLHQCRLPLSTHTLTYLADLLRRHPKAIRFRWRALPPGRIAVIVLASPPSAAPAKRTARTTPASIAGWARCRSRALADLGFIGLDDAGDDPVVVTGFKATHARKLAPAEREPNRILAAGRAPVERGFTHLKNWRTSPSPALTTLAPPTCFARCSY